MKDIARKYNCPFFETSAVSGENVPESFYALLKEIKYGKKKDPFLQEYPYYSPQWKSLVQVLLFIQWKIITLSLLLYIDSNRRRREY